MRAPASKYKGGRPNWRGRPPESGHLPAKSLFGRFKVPLWTVPNPSLLGLQFLQTVLRLVVDARLGKGFATLYAGATLATMLLATLVARPSLRIVNA